MVWVLGGVVHGSKTEIVITNCFRVQALECQVWGLRGLAFGIL